MAKILRPKRGTVNASSAHVLAKGELLLQYGSSNNSNGPGKIYVGNGTATVNNLTPFISDPSFNYMPLNGGTVTGNIVLSSDKSNIDENPTIVPALGGKNNLGESDRWFYQTSTDNIITACVIAQKNTEVAYASGGKHIRIEYDDISFGKPTGSSETVDTWDGTNSSLKTSVTNLKNTTTYLNSEVGKKLDKSGGTVTGNISWNGSSGYTSGLYWKENGYGDQFKIYPAFGGTGDQNYLALAAATGGSGTTPSLSDVIKFYPSGKIQATASGSGWHKARDNAAFKSHTVVNDGSLYPALSMLATAGSWCVGVLGNNNSLYFSWTRNAEYTSDTNKTDQYYITPVNDGTAHSYEILHAGNYYNYAIPRSNGTYTQSWSGTTYTGNIMAGRNVTNHYTCLWTSSKLHFYVDNSDVGNLSDKRLKDDIEDYNPDLVDAIANCKVYQFKAKNRGGVISYGIIAQDLVEECEKRNIDILDYDVLYKSTYRDDDPTEYYFMEYSQLNFIRTLYLQNENKALRNEINEIKNQIEELKKNINII